MGVLINRGSKKGQEIMGMSIGTIFSIFIIVVIIAVAIYVIVHFLGVNRCAEVGFLYEDLQSEIDKAWTSERYSGSYAINLANSGTLKTNVEKICFGNLTVSSAGEDREIQDKVEYGSYLRNANVFMYPADKVCQGLASKKIQHVNIGSFFCYDVEDSGEIAVRLKKEPRDNLVELSKI